MVSARHGIWRGFDRPSVTSNPGARLYYRTTITNPYAPGPAVLVAPDPPPKSRDDVIDSVKFMITAV